MGAYDTAFQGKGLIPTVTTETVFFTAGTDSDTRQCQVNVNACPIGAGSVNGYIGIRFQGAGSTFWLVHNRAITKTDPLIGLGPIYLKVGDQIRVQASIINEMSFSATGTRDS